MLLHSSHKAFFRSPAGPAPAGSRVTIRFLSDESEAVILRAWNGTESNHVMDFDGHNLFSTNIEIPQDASWVWYDFIVYQRDGRMLRYGNAYDKLGGEGAVYETGEVAAFQITVYQPAFKTPGFMQGANIYQIFPDRFFRAPTKAVDDRDDRFVHAAWNEEMLDEDDKRGGEYREREFYGGTLNGIRKKLPYLQKLGITVLYLNPVFKARSYHRYDTSDYLSIDPLLGTQEDFEALCAEAEKHGLRVMLDGVFSHTGDDSLYFNRYGHFDTVGAYQSEKSPYYAWYSFKEWPDSYRCWWNIATLPEIDKANEAYRKFMFDRKRGVVPHWIDAGSAGWRLDVADELSMDFLRKLRLSAKRAKRDAVVLGEVWEDASCKEAYGELRNYCAGDTLDSVMNYPLRTALLDFASRKSTAKELARLINHQAEVYPAQFRYALMNLVGSHDRARALNFLVGREGEELTKPEQLALRLTKEEYALAAERYRMCVDILCALPGCPTVYYGDEAGMTGCHDPFCRRTYPWGGEDTKLRGDIAAKLNRRKASSVLKYGFCKVTAPDEDTLLIYRYLDGKTDALGRKTTVTGREVLRISRKGR